MGNGADAEGGRGSERAFNLPWLVVAVMVLCVGVQAAREWILTPDQDFALIVHGAFIPIRYTGGYPVDVWAFTSPLTSSLIHGSWVHLAVNMVWLAAFASPLATRLGVARFIVFWVFTTLASLALHFAFHSHDPVPVVGASGAISGMMGAAARFGFRIDRSAALPIFAGPPMTLVQTLRSRTALVFLAVWLAINIATGVGFAFAGGDGLIAWEAHIGGMIAGLLALPLFDRPRPALH